MTKFSLTFTKLAYQPMNLSCADLLISVPSDPFNTPTLSRTRLTLLERQGTLTSSFL